MAGYVSLCVNIGFMSLLVGGQHGGQHDSKKPASETDYWEYGAGWKEGTNDYNTYHYNNNEPPDYGEGYRDTEIKYKCYTCTYKVDAEHQMGQTQCRDPFIKSGIPVVECTGPCAKIYFTSGEKEYLVNRNCLHNCKNVRNPEGYTECCTGDFCNSAHSMVAWGSRLGLLPTCLLLYTLLTWS